MQEEIRQSNTDGTSSKVEDEENCALARKGLGRNLNQKEIMVRRERRNNCQILNVFNVMSWDTMPHSVRTRRSERST